MMKGNEIGKELREKEIETEETGGRNQPIRVSAYAHMNFSLVG